MPFNGREDNSSSHVHYIVYLQADVFSFGIIMCEMTARIDADPDIMPRTKVQLNLP